MITLYAVLLYLIIGLLFAIIFLVRLIHTIDDAVSISPWTFRLMIFPGCVVFWPLLLQRYLTVRKSQGHD